MQTTRPPGPPCRGRLLCRTRLRRVVALCAQRPSDGRQRPSVRSAYNPATVTPEPSDGRQTAVGEQEVPRWPHGGCPSPTGPAALPRPFRRRIGRFRRSAAKPPDPSPRRTLSTIYRKPPKNPPDPSIVRRSRAGWCGLTRHNKPGPVLRSSGIGRPGSSLDAKRAGWCGFERYNFSGR